MIEADNVYSRKDGIRMVEKAFADLKPGDAFVYFNVPFLKTGNSSLNGNAFNLFNKALTRFTTEQLVIPVSLTITITMQE